MPIRLFPLILLLALLAACVSDADRVVSPTGVSSETLSAEAERKRALGMALDTLEAFVVTLESIQDPMSAWNQAERASRLLRYLEVNRASFSLGADEAEAARQYPEEIERLKRLETRRDLEMNRIMQDPVMSRVLIDEMNTADEAGKAQD